MNIILILDFHATHCVPPCYRCPGRGKIVATFDYAAIPSRLRELDGLHLWDRSSGLTGLAALSFCLSFAADGTRVEWERITCEHIITL